MKFLSALAVATVLFAVPAGATDVKAVVAVPRQRVQTADIRANGHLVRVDANGNRTSFPISIKAHGFPGILRVMVEFGSVTKAGADSSAMAHIPSHLLLEMRPNGQNSILIAHPGDKTPTSLPFDKWSDGPLGPGFSYEDFFEPEFFWPGQTLVEATKFGARACDVVKSTPGATYKTQYAEVRTWLDRGIGFPVYAEKTPKGSGAVKEFTYFGLRKNGGVWSASQIEVKVRGHAGSTLLIVDRGSPKANLGLADFSPELLTHF